MIIKTICEKAGKYPLPQTAYFLLKVTPAFKPGRAISYYKTIRWNDCINRIRNIFCAEVLFAMASRAPEMNSFNIFPYFLFTYLSVSG